MRHRTALLLALTCLLCLVWVACSPADPPVEGSESRAEPFQAPGTLRMAERLALLAEHARADPHPFLNHERVRRLEALPIPERPTERFEAVLKLGRELLWAGRTDEAVARLESLRGEASDLGPTAERLLGQWLATTYLRLGEQQNCIAHHNAEACLLPIRGQGVHHLPEGSRAARAELDVLLGHDPDDLEARWLDNLAAMTLGEYPDGVPEDRRIPTEVFRPATLDDRPPVEPFVDVAAERGVSAPGLAGGSVLEDFDRDGDLDLLVSSWGMDDPLRYFEQGDDGHFVERGAAAGLDGLGGGLNLLQADFDNDGWIDVLVLRGAWLIKAGRQPNSLLRNLGPVAGDGGIAFEDVSEATGLLSFHPTQTAAWADFDGDGWLDLFIGNESFPGRSHPCELYLSNGAGDGDGSGDGTTTGVTFRQVAAEVGVAAGGVVKGVAAGDIDDDGRPDLYLSRLLEPNLLFHNRTDGEGRLRFEEIAEAAGVGEPLHSFPTGFLDFDQDGRLDLFVAGYAGDYFGAGAAPVVADWLDLPHDAETPRLYRNLGPSTEGDTPAIFEDVTEAMGLAHPLFAMGMNIDDLDGDGFPDLYLATGAPSFRALIPNKVFFNVAGRRFHDVTYAAALGHLQKGHGVSVGDVDGDGDQDVYNVLGGAYSGDGFPNVLFLAPGRDRAFVTLRLEGVQANRSALGARLRLELEGPDGPRQLHATVGSGASFGASSLQVELGLGEASRLGRLEIRWPGSGTVQVFEDLPIRRVLTLREGSPEPVSHLR